MRYNYKGFWGSDSCCDIEVQHRNDGKYVFVATEVPEKPGISVTNCAEHLATSMRKEYRLKPEDVIWFRTPVCTRITEQAVDELIAGKRNVEDLGKFVAPGRWRAMFRCK